MHHLLALLYENQDVNECNCLPSAASAPAGPVIPDKRLTEVLVSYWQRDALLQLLLHAVRVLLQHGALLQQGQQATLGLRGGLSSGLRRPR